MVRSWRFARNKLLGILFGFTAAVTRRTYLLVGFSLMALKYLEQIKRISES